MHLKDDELVSGLDDGQQITLEARAAVHHLVAEFASMPGAT
jgi:hypothetical protein